MIIKLIIVAWLACAAIVAWMMHKAPLVDEDQQPIERDST